MVRVLLFDLDGVTAGRISRADWVRQVGEMAGSAPAAEEWGVQPAVVDDALLELSDDIRCSGLRTAVLTNGTDTISAEIAALGIADRFDAIFNSADIGFVKPDVRTFKHALRDLAVAAEEVFFTDDSESKLAGTDSLSMRTHLFEGIDDLRDHLIKAGIEVSRPPF